MNEGNRDVRRILAAILLATAAADGWAQELPPEGIDSTPTWTFVSDIAGAGLGNDVASAGDINGDGYEDIVAGAQSHGSGAGRAYVFHGGPQGLSTEPDWIVDGVGTSRFGQVVTGVGDVNADGFDDVLIGAPAYSNAQSTPHEGAVFLWYGSAQGLRPISSGGPNWICQGSASNRRLGHCIAGRGDINGDGHPDIAIGVPGLTSPSSFTGEVWIFHGGPGGPGATPASILTAPTDGSVAEYSFARSLRFAGNVNGDSHPVTQLPLDDLLVGATNGPEGSLFLYGGGTAGVAPAPFWTLATHSGLSLTNETSPAGDFNGDGTDDIALIVYVGTPIARLVWVIHGVPGGPPSTSPQAVFESDNETVQVGRSLISAGDTDGDGFDDLLVGCASWSDGFGHPDVLFLLRGHPGATVNSIAWAGSHPAFQALFPDAPAIADVNGNGLPDVIAGASNYYSNSANLNGGALFAYHDVAGPPALPQQPGQFLLDESTPIAVGGTTTETGIVCRATVSDPIEGGPVMLQVELKPVDLPFTGSPGDIVTGSPVATGSIASVRVEGLASATDFHWRFRSARADGSHSTWFAFGDNPESEPDFSIPVNHAPPSATPVAMDADGSPLLPGVKAFNPGPITFSAPSSDPDGNPVRLELEIRSSGVPFQGIPTSIGGMATPGSAAAVTIALADGSHTAQARFMDPWGPGPWTELGTYRLMAVGSSNPTAGCAVGPLPRGLFLIAAGLALAVMRRR